MHFRGSPIEILFEFVLQKMFVGERTKGGEEMTCNSSKEVWKQGDQIMAEVMVALMADCEIDNIVKLSAEQANCPVHKLHPVEKNCFLYSVCAP